MERKIGEIFEVNGKWYQCVEANENDNCNACDLQGLCIIMQGKQHVGNCMNWRTDNKRTVYKKLEKVGEPYMLEDKKFQKYKVFKTPYIYHKIDCSWRSFSDPYYISLEIKEDMEENKLSLKPFDIQKAREGKPVCTRGGRKARIICFDRKLYHNGYNYPIVAMVNDNDNDNELIHAYTQDGLLVGNKECELDLMMLPEKKEGWAVIRKSDIYETEEQAKEVLLNSRVGVMIRKINWEE